MQNQFSQNQFQPTGFVQSYYDQSKLNRANQFAQNRNAFHASNYRGNQQGHDQYLRSDSFQPSNMQQSQNAQSFHASNYRGNQQGHDQYLRADSFQPSNIQNQFQQSQWQRQSQQF